MALPRPVVFSIFGTCLALSAWLTFCNVQEPPPRVLTEPPPGLSVRCATTGKVFQLSYFQYQDVAALFRTGELDPDRAAQAPLCPTTEKPYQGLVVLTCPETGKPFAVAFSDTPERPFSAEEIRRLSPFINPPPAPVQDPG